MNGNKWRRRAAQAGAPFLPFSGFSVQRSTLPFLAFSAALNYNLVAHARRALAGQFGVRHQRGDPWEADTPWQA
jgi:hypothetical protein